MTTLDGTALARALRAAADALHPTPAGPRPVANALPDEYPPRVNDPAGERKILDDFLDHGFVGMDDLAALRRQTLGPRAERDTLRRELRSAALDAAGRAHGPCGELLDDGPCGAPAGHDGAHLFTAWSARVGKLWRAGQDDDRPTYAHDAPYNTIHEAGPEPCPPPRNRSPSPPSATESAEPPHPGVSGAGRGSQPLTGLLEGWHAVFAGKGESPIHIRDGVPLGDALARYLDDANTTAEAKLAIALRAVLFACHEQQEFMIDLERRAAGRPGTNQRLDDITQGHRTGMIEMANRVIGAALRDLNPDDMPESAENAGWRAGVRWAAAEADAQAVQTRTVADIIDITDHLRLCASFPTRETLIERWEAPEVRP